MGSQTTPAILQNPDIAASYQAVYDILTKAYWESSDLASKDQIYSAQQEIKDFITTLDEQDIKDLTAKFVGLKPRIDATNKALQQIRSEVNQITKNISTASTVVAAISKLLSLLPA